MTLGIVLVTTGSEAEAQTIARSLVEAKLAACVSYTPVRSVYTWDGVVHDDAEWQLVIKTDLDRFAELEQRVMTLHAYAVPEIIAIPIAQGAAPYIQWLTTSLA